MDLGEVLNRAKEQYNRFRAPEARLEILEINEEKREALIKIEGSFCWTCGVDDWIDDFRFVLEDLNVKAKIESYSIDLEREAAIAKLRLDIPRKASQS